MIIFLTLEINPPKTTFLSIQAESILEIAVVFVSKSFLKSFSGCELTKSPKSSFSQLSLSKLLAGAAESNFIFIAPTAGTEAKSPICFELPFLLFSLAISKSFSRFAKSWPLSAKASKAPAFIKASIDFLFKSFECTLVIKSPIDLKGPVFFLSSTIASIIFVPTFLTANNPNLIWFFFGTTVKFFKLSFMFGGKTSTFIFLHSSIKNAILSTSAFSEVKTDAINSTG